MIKNLHITGDVPSAGLFGTTGEGAVVKNVGFEGTYIRTMNVTDNAGAVCGVNNGTISHCYNTGSVKTSWLDSTSAAGGICGTNYGGAVTYCYNTGDISAYGGYETFVGGIIGISYDGSIDCCYNTGALYGESVVYQDPEVGGICGNAHCPISNCYNTGSVYATTANGFFDPAAGGICGYIQKGYEDTYINNCYNTGSVYVSYSSYGTSSDTSSVHAGGILGWSNALFGLCSVINCVSLPSSVVAENEYYPDNMASYFIGETSGTKSGNLALEDISGNAENDADRLITSDEAKSQATYKALGWDFNNVWAMVPGYDYPQLQGMNENGGTTPLSDDATLSALTVSEGTLTPDFDPAITSYSATVANSIESIDIGAAANDANAVVSGAGAKTLDVGVNSFNIVVTAENGNTETYIVAVTREDATIELTGITISGPAKTEYTVGDALDLSGLAVTANYSEGNPADVTALATISPANGAILNDVGNQPVTVGYGGFSTSFMVTVNAKPSGQTDVQFLQAKAADILNNGLGTNDLLLNGKVLTLVIDGREFVLSTNANNRNISGEIALGDGYYLQFDIKGNGSNIKEFSIIQK